MRQYLISIFACSAIYYISFVLNMLFFDFYIHSYGVNWVFMPSGVQLVLVLIAVESAAIAIAIVSWIIGFYYFFTGSVFFTLITGIIAGLSPLLARKVAFDYLKIEDDLKNLTFIGILKTSIIFASISAILHQLWYFHSSQSENFLQNLAVMAIGNLLGTLIVLVLIKLLADKLKKKIPFE